MQNRKSIRLVTAVFLVSLGVAANAWAQNQAPSDDSTAKSSGGDVFETTVEYVKYFYPLWFTYYQTLFGTPNLLVGPDKISPIYHYVVAINDDTLYVSSYLDLSVEPLVLTIPDTTARYSVLILDHYGDIVPSVIKAPATGTFVLYGPGFNGTLPAAPTPVPLPLNYMTLIFRVDKFKDGVDMTSEADKFRRSVSSQPLCLYQGQTCPQDTPSLGPAHIVPEAVFAFPFKTLADSLIATDPIFFLRMLQIAVQSPKTPPMSPEVQALSNNFNALFASGTSNRSEFARGAQAAHAAIVNRYLDHTGATNWITYTNIGVWEPDEFVQRSSITQFIQYANNHDAAAYYHAFKDGDGLSLNGTNPSGYVLTFPADQIPAADRFWSLTAYTPEAIELVPNTANKYLVASYTGPQPNKDGSISIYMARQLPPGVNMANWLPIPPGPFNVMLRVYGPLGSVKDNTYVPPAIVKLP
ncbi:MAG: DUF1254 domain-containing protein [Acidobacteriaceae bacterium]|nr:DUF1254 domain-containing protein [Acidobacteriaceae bacterium]